MKFPAIYTITHDGSGRPVKCCERHMRSLVAVMSLFGSTPLVSVDTTGSECTNCVNEYRLGMNDND